MWDYYVLGFQNMGNPVLDPVVFLQQQFANQYPIPVPTKG